MITDGLPEMTDPKEEFYTLERVETDLRTLLTAMPSVITETLAANVLAFAAGTPAADDVTVMAVRRL